MKRKFVCSVCREPISYLAAQFESRIEIRSCDRTRSLYSKTIAYYCGTCAHAEGEQLKGSPDRQGALL